MKTQDEITAQKLRGCATAEAAAKRLKCSVRQAVRLKSRLKLAGHADLPVWREGRKPTVGVSA